MIFVVHGRPPIDGWRGPFSAGLRTLASPYLPPDKINYGFNWSLDIDYGSPPAGYRTSRVITVASALANHIQIALYPLPSQGKCEPIDLWGHSHGGPISIHAASILKSRGYDVKTVITAGTPYKLPPTSLWISVSNVNIYNYWSSGDDFSSSNSPYTNISWPNISGHSDWHNIAHQSLLQSYRDNMATAP